MNPPHIFNEIRLLWNLNKTQSLIDGKLILADFEFLFCSNDGKQDLQATYTQIESIDKRPEGTSTENPYSKTTNHQKRKSLNLFPRFILDIQFKQCTRWLFLLKNEAHATEVQKSLLYHQQKMSVHNVDKSFLAFNYTLPIDRENDGWEIFSIQKEFERMFKHIPTENRWKLSTINKDFQICSSYPSLISIPPGYDESLIYKVKDFRDGGRFPSLSWINPKTVATISRCSQPLPGRLGNKRCIEDELLLATIFGSNPNSPKFGGYILDARPYSNAMANRALGAGFENTEFYRNCRIKFLSIDNIHAVRDSLDKLKRICRGSSDLNWHEKISDTAWLKHIYSILYGASLIAHLVHEKSTSIIVHCSHGWDRTAQLTSLAMLLMDPFYRTIIGFQTLVEKEWLSFGHKFFDRCNHRNLQNLNKEESPIFIQFIDCVWQIMKQHPSQFEFNEKFLLDVIENVYSCKYGTFICNNEREQVILGVKEKTSSLWTVLNHSSVRKTYTNPLYLYKLDTLGNESELSKYLKIEVKGSKIAFWEALYTQSENSPTFEQILTSEYQELYDKLLKLELELKEKTEQHSDSSEKDKGIPTEDVDYKE